MRTDYNKIPRERERERKAYGIHIDTKRMNVGDNVSI